MAQKKATTLKKMATLNFYMIKLLGETKKMPRIVRRGGLNVSTTE